MREDKVLLAKAEGGNDFFVYTLRAWWNRVALHSSQYLLRHFVTALFVSPTVVGILYLLSFPYWQHNQGTLFLLLLPFSLLSHLHYLSGKQALLARPRITSGLTTLLN